MKIQLIADNIDQLDLALDQLAIRDRNFDRFAYLLIDNVVELTLHSFAEDMKRVNHAWRNLKKPEHDPQAIEKGLSQRFGDKVRAAKILGLFDATSCETILKLHSYRNTAYHQGLRHESILHSLAIFYFRSACSLLRAYKPDRLTHGGNQTFSHRAMKYLGGLDTKNISPFKLIDAAYRRLDSVAASLPENLIGDLFADLSATIESVNTAIKYIAENEPQKGGRKDIVIYAQLWPFIYGPEGKQFARSKGYNRKSDGQYHKWFFHNFNWPCKSDPIDRWRKKAKLLEKEKDYRKALKKYCDFMEQHEKIRSQIISYAEGLEDHIQLQIDESREE
ncbi:MAG: hypothetical protein LUE17_05820 [Planctomycetaceae bacterium]|nr:hypothetical protein [Planctomycetaceae bacterium]